MSKLVSMFCFLFALTVHITNPVGVTISKKNGPMRNLAVKPHQMVTFGRCIGVSCTDRGFYRPHLPIEFATRYHCQLPYWTEMIERKSVVYHKYCV
ncbi:hypothetical protein TNCT_320751 [Trichonephila clavata]|uniref:Uncharacterized protein n=1 Tax=Trichonephila clavata TaxID=2740835 RepID=A0A8X6H2E8_TRICU|nr:hypothetical protein TNCT_320751 [Trichonephila clavata]